ncbi:hypothetical protein ACVIWV_008904 [Bradyrhizobium diazoefficiens]|nr:hypothetical protein [Bradyrhizobium diazoefficiens]MBR0868498.1 hypothetical protein [Bradyrhizobium diazoefficiens]MBR0893060.1 hypothetical protein [Bradyrhizobium diazoefficiens]MBR0924753.1 hypothetical protein [Bradyrhizobium diazoefficiens]
MPLFYFDLRDGDATAIDETGMQFPGLRAAMEEAVRVLNVFANQAEGSSQKSYLREMIIEVRDEKGNVTEVSHSNPTTHQGRLS